MIAALTTFTVGIHSNADAELDLDDLFDELEDRVGIGIFEFSSQALTTVESEKWVDHEADMAEISIDHADTVFFIKGREEDGDVWTKFFSDGSVQRVHGTLDGEFDPQQLEVA
jgi:hypothetical protein